MEAVCEFGGLDLTLTSTMDAVLKGYTYFRDGDVVVAKITPCFENGKGSLAVNLTNGIGFGTTELHVLRAGKELNPDFLFYLTISHDFRHRGAGWMYGAGGQKRVPEEFLRTFEAPLPSLDEQRAIAAWLDDRTRRIDELVATERRLIELLAERWTALIARAVTKGLHPDAPMKSTQIDWLGSVPEHWKVTPLKYAVTFQRGHDLPTEERIEGDIPVVSSAGPSAWHNRPMAIGPGIVTGRYGTIGIFHLVRGPYWPLNTTLYSISLHGNNPFYMKHMLHTLKAVFLLNAAKSAVPGVDRNDLHPIPVAVPPRSEQDQIAEYLDSAEAKHYALTAAAEAVIERLSEYRQALISAAVTGKIDVRGVKGEAA